MPTPKHSGAAGVASATLAHGPDSTTPASIEADTVHTLANIERLSPAFQIKPGADELDLHNLISARLQQASSITTMLMDHRDLDLSVQGMMWALTDLVDEAIAGLQALDQVRMNNRRGETP